MRIYSSKCKRNFLDNSKRVYILIKVTKIDRSIIALTIKHKKILVYKHYWLRTDALHLGTALGASHLVVLRSTTHTIITE
jgi:hypothetical protein